MAEPRINFFYVKTEIPGFKEHKTREWIQNVVKNEDGFIGYLQIIFCTDDKLIEINRKYLDHDTLTDIITFNYNDDFDGIAGDLFISYERVEENAAKFGELVKHELYRVIVHGVLHLLGYNDERERDRSEMREKENYYLNLLPK